MNIKDLNTAYLELFMNNKREFLDEFKNKLWPELEASSVRYKGRPVPFLYHPFMIDKTEWNNLKELIESFNQILDKVIARYLDDRKFRSYFPFSEEMEEYILVEPGYSNPYPVARFDIFYYNDSIKFCELNTDGTSAMNEVRGIQEIVANGEAVTQLKLENNLKLEGFELFDSLIDIMLAKYDDFLSSYPESQVNFKKDKPVIGIVDFSKDGTISEFKEFQRWFDKRGILSYILDPRDVENRDDGLYYNNKRIDLVYRRATTGRLFDHYSEIGDFLTAYKDHKFCMFGSFRSQIIHNKAIFQILSNKEYLDFLDEAELEFISQHIPETGLLTKNSIEAKNIKDNKDKYILKPDDGFAGKGIKLGAETSQEEWLDFLDQSVNKPYLYQNYCQPPTRKMISIDDGEVGIDPYYYQVGLYVFDGQVQGIYTRAGREKIIGSDYECFTVPTYLVSKK
ncbi:MAG: hypothetical protein ACOCVD_00075 [Bacillota bacterium]